MGEPQRELELHQKAVTMAEELHRRAPESVEYARNLALFCYNLLLNVQHADRVLAASCVRRILTVVEEMRDAGVVVDELLGQKYQEVHAYHEALDQGFHEILPASTAATQTSSDSHTVSLWKKVLSFQKSRKLFGVKESRPADLAEMEPAPKPANFKPQAPSISPMPLISPRPGLPLALSAAAGEESDSLGDAAQDGDLEKVKALLKINPELANSKDEFGHTPLHYAGVFGHKEVAQLLLASKAEVNAKDNKGRTALHETVHAGNTELAKLLLLNRAEVNARDDDDATPLHLAANRGHKEVADLLLANDAEINAKEKHGSTPLHIATGLGFRGMVELLLANRADLNSHSNTGQTPLHVAAGLGLKDLTGLLLANDAPVNAREIHGATPLHLAAFGAHKDVAAVLLANGAEVNS